MESENGNLCFICMSPASKKCSNCEDDVYYCCQEHYKLHRSVNNDGEAQCNPFKILFTEGVGRYMVANRDIQPGEVVFQDRAAAVGPSESNPLCLDCNGKIVEEKFLRCPVCLFPLCDEECIKGSEHLKICAYLKGMGSQVKSFDEPNPIYDVILPLKLLLLKKTEPEWYSILINFMDHIEYRKSFAEYWDQVKTNVIDVIMGMPGIVEEGLTNESELCQIIGILETNTHEIYNRYGYCYRGIYMIASFPNHNCIVNARPKIIKEAPYISTFQANVQIPKGGEIFTTYIWPHLPTRKRRQTLREGWHFSCTCPRCSDPSELGALTSAILCKSCQGGYLLNENPLEDDKPEQWKCHQCGENGNSEEILAMVDELTNEVENLPRNDLEGNLNQLKKCREFLHCNHSVLTELRVRLIPIICRGPGKGTQQFPEETIEHKKKLCQENLAVLKIITPGLTRQRGGCLFELQDCIFFLAKRQYEEGKMDDIKFLESLKECKQILIECCKCLNNEPHNTVEKFYEMSAKGALKVLSEQIMMLSCVTGMRG